MSDLGARLRKVLDGIDRTETDTPPGWWETSTGATFGAERLAEVLVLLEPHDEVVQRLRALADKAEARGKTAQEIPELNLVGNAYVGMAQRIREALGDPHEAARVERVVAAREAAAKVCPHGMHYDGFWCEDCQAEKERL